MTSLGAAARVVATTAVVSLGACAQCGPSGGMTRGEPSPAPSGGSASNVRVPAGAMSSAAEARRWLLERNANQLAEAQRRLAITPEQSPAWERFSDSVGQLITDMSRFEADPISATAMQRVDRRVDVARNRYAALESVADSMQRLYAVMTPEQRAIADRMLAGALPGLYEGTPFSTGAPEPATAPGGQPPRRGRGEPPRPQ